MENSQDGMLREILGRVIALEVQVNTVKSEIKDLKDSNKEFSEKITRITSEYQQARGAVFFANWIFVATITLVAGIGGVWLTKLDNSQSELNHESHPSKIQRP